MSLSLSLSDTQIHARMHTQGETQLDGRMLQVLEQALEHTKSLSLSLRHTHARARARAHTLTHTHTHHREREIERKDSAECFALHHAPCA